jgi:hypothetical protein
MSGPRETEHDLLQLTDELLEQTAALKRQWQDLARSVGAEIPEAEPAPPSGRDHGRRELSQPADPRRLVAVEMMLGGRGREEVEAFLRSEFGDEAAEAIVAEVYRGT